MLTDTLLMILPPSEDGDIIYQTKLIMDKYQGSKISFDTHWRHYDLSDLRKIKDAEPSMQCDSIMFTNRLTKNGDLLLARMSSKDLFTDIKPTHPNRWDGTLGDALNRYITHTKFLETQQELTSEQVDMIRPNENWILVGFRYWPMPAPKVEHTTDLFNFDEPEEGEEWKK